MSTTRLDRTKARRLGAREVVALISMPCLALVVWLTSSVPPLVGVAACVVVIALSPSWQRRVKVPACALVSAATVAAGVSGPTFFSVTCSDMGSCYPEDDMNDILEVLASAVLLGPVIALMLAVLARRRLSGTAAYGVASYQDGAIAVVLGVTLTASWWVDGFDDVGPFVAVPIGVVLVTLIVFALRPDAWPGAHEVPVMVSLMAWGVVQMLYVSQPRYECVDPQDSSVVLREPCDQYPEVTDAARGFSLSVALGVSGYLVYETARRHRTLNHLPANVTGRDVE